MNNTIKPVAVRILDKDYMVACPEGEQDALLASARRVDREMRKVRESGRVLGTDRIAVMVALNLAHELLQEGKSSDSFSAEERDTAREQVQSLQERVEAALIRHKS